jgi:hypothetical protein
VNSFEFSPADLRFIRFPPCKKFLPSRPCLDSLGIKKHVKSAFELRLPGSGSSASLNQMGSVLQEDVLSDRPSKTAYSQEPIAVIGLACRLPGHCNSPDALWKFLERGGVAHNEAPESRFNLKTHHDGSRKLKTMRSPGGMFLEDIDPQDFDAQFFSVPAMDAMAMDPQQRQLLEVVYECLENAGISLESVAGKPIGCFVGSYAVGMKSLQCGYNLFLP